MESQLQHRVNPLRDVLLHKTIPERHIGLLAGECLCEVFGDRVCTWQQQQSKQISVVQMEQASGISHVAAHKVVSVLTINCVEIDLDKLRVSKWKSLNFND